MGFPDRALKQLSSEIFDLIIVGGGVYGVMLSLEAGFLGKRALLMEKSDFGGATTYNHLRTLHGGLRYLQTLDLHRFFESVNERQWFFSHFPQMVRVLPCLMPLYDKGVRRKSIFNIALRVNDLLSRNRNQQVVPQKHLPDGYTISPDEVKELFPMVDSEGLTGGAIWYDGMIVEPERLLMEILHWSGDMGASLLNYVEADQLLSRGNQTTGVRAFDRVSGSEFEFHAPIVVNAAGPWCREIAREFDQDFKKLFPEYLLLWNVLFKRKALSDYSVTVSPSLGKGQTYFIHNWKGRVLAGTGQALVEKMAESSGPDDRHLMKFLDDLNNAIPGLGVRKADIDHIYYGLLPGTKKGRLTKRETILSHEAISGPKGLFSVSGIKFTTSRLVAQKAMASIFPEEKNRFVERKLSSAEKDGHQTTFSFDWMPDENDGRWKETLRYIMDTESVIHLDDLLVRRTSLGENKQRLQAILPEIRELFPLNEHQWQEEVRKLHQAVKLNPAE